MGMYFSSRYPWAARLLLWQFAPRMATVDNNDIFDRIAIGLGTIAATLTGILTVMRRKSRAGNGESVSGDGKIIDAATNNLRETSGTWQEMVATLTARAERGEARAERAEHEVWEGAQRELKLQRRIDELEIRLEAVERELALLKGAR